MNCAEVFWGANAKEFEPERWLDAGGGGIAKAKEIQGHRHILSFSDGPRTCLGKTFALAELKVRFQVPSSAPVRRSCAMNACMTD